MLNISGEKGLGKEERVIKDRLQELIARIKVVGYKEHWIRLTREYVKELQQRGVYCVDRFVQRLKRCTNGKDPREYWEILMEGRFAIILARNGFKEIHIEYSDKGMDIKANWNRNAIYFDVTRKRSKVDEWAEQPEDVELPSGKPEDIIISRIQRKMGQLQSGEINIVVFWSSTLAVLHLDMAEAFKCIQQEIDQNPGTYQKLSGVLFTEDGGTNVATGKQFSLFKNKKASKPIGIRLAGKLWSIHEQNPKQIQRNWEAVALKLMETKGKQ